MDMEKEEERELQQYEGLIQGLMNDHYGSCDDFVDDETLVGLRDNIQRFCDAGEMQAAGLGNKKDYQKDKLFRGDRIRWIEEESIDLFELVFLKKVNSFISHLNRTCYTSIRSFESHYANYEEKSFYKRHLDQFKTDNSRKYSIILYLNDDWKIEDEGMLSLYPKAGLQKDISPTGGRLVFFKSDEMEHEVHPSHTRQRNSIAGWLKA